MRTIALISEHASPLATAGGTDSGGQNIYVANIARQLARRDWRVDVFTRRDNRFTREVVNWLPGIRVIHLDAGPPRPIPKEELLPLMDEFGDNLLRMCGRRQYDLLHANFFMSGRAALPVRERHGLPLMVTFHALGRVRRRHQNQADLFPDERFAVEDRLIREADRIIAECPEERSDLVSLYQADPERIDVVPCGFDPREMRPMDRAAARRSLGWSAKEFIVLHVGRLVPRKGVDDVIRAVAALRRNTGLEARLYVVGGNSERPDPGRTPEIGRLQQLAVDCGVERQVCFLGRRPHEALAEYYAAADVFATTPWYEPFGITPVEAMACGTPVVGSRVGGIRTTVLDGVTGLLVPPQDPAALAAALAELAADPQLRRRMGLAGRNRALRHYTWQNVGNRLAGIFERAIVSNPRRSSPAPASAEARA
jgi:glycosyltransferase involved in cell wall biosynthesis